MRGITVERDMASNENKCPHGFESCEVYVQRALSVSRDVVVVWVEGDPADDLMFKIDRIERQMKILGILPWKDRCAGSFVIDRDKCMRKLLEMLEAGAEELSEICFGFIWM